jgi:2-dehydropantoate 2-reductase
MRLLVTGAGATGGYFGGRLAGAGRDVTFLVRPGRAAQLRQNGLDIVSPNGNLSVRPKIVTADELKDSFDVILLTVKSYSLAAALDDLAPAVGPATLIVPVLNGMRHLDTIAERFGVNAVAGGLCRIVATLDNAGRVVQLTPLHDLVFGELDGSLSPRIKAVADVLAGAGFATRLSDNIRRDMWGKWLLLAALGAVTCLMRGSIGEIVAAPGGRAFADAVIDECLAVIAAVGTPLDPAAITMTRTLLTEAGSPFVSSMYRDLIAGHEIEADQIVGDLVGRAGRAGVPTPLLSAAYSHLCVYAARR